MRAAAAAGHQEAVARLLEAAPRLLVTAIVAGAERGQEQLLRSLLTSDPPDPPSLSTEDPGSGLTPLTAAARGGEPDILRLVISSLAAADSAASSASTSADSAASLYDEALLLAAEAGHVAVVELLLDQGARVEPGDTCAVDTRAGDTCGLTPLEVAARAGHLGVVQLLAGRGAGLDTATPTELAVVRGHAQVVCWLLGAGAGEPVSALHLAVTSGQGGVAGAVLDTLQTAEDSQDTSEHWRLDSLDSVLESLLDTALGRGDLEMVTLLLDRGAALTPGAWRLAGAREDIR